MEVWAVLVDWQTRVGDQDMCSYYQGVILLSILRTPYAKVLERILWSVIKP